MCSHVFQKKWANCLCVAILKGSGDIHPITIEAIFRKKSFEKNSFFINETVDKVDKYNGGFVKGSTPQDNVLLLLGRIKKQMCLNRTLFVSYMWILKI